MADRFRCIFDISRCCGLPILGKNYPKIIFFLTILLFSAGCKVQKIITPIPSAPPDSTSILSVDSIYVPAANGKHLNTVHIFGGTYYVGGEDGLLLRGSPSRLNAVSIPIQNQIWNFNSVGEHYLGFADNGYVLWSFDGQTWDSIRVSPYSFRQSAVGLSGRVWATADNSPGPFVAASPYLSWNHPTISNASNSSFSAVAFDSSGIYGYITTSTAGYRTMNGGIDWSAAADIASPANDILFLSSNELLMACNGGVILHSTNFGASWDSTNIAASPLEQFNRVIKVSDQMYLAISLYNDTTTTINSRRGRIYHSHDKINWTLTSDINHWLHDICYDPTQGAFVCGTESYFAVVSFHR